MTILREGDPNFKHSDPRYKHYFKIIRLENGDEIGECECGRKILYGNVFSSYAIDNIYHHLIPASVVPRYKYSEQFLRGV